MNDLRHDNLAVFAGACVDADQVSILTKYCTRGSLDDVLQNHDIQLDLMFKVSFAMDIINVSLAISFFKKK